MTQVGNVYGEALYTLALEEQLTEALLGELTVLSQCFRENPDFKIITIRGVGYKAVRQ